MPECGLGACVEAHPAHCCHVLVGETRRTPKGAFCRGFVCVVCGKTSRTWVAIRAPRGEARGPAI